VSGDQFVVTDKDRNLLNQVSPVFGSQKFPIPTPVLSPSVRQKRRLAWRNERSFYHRTCDLSGEPVVSIYSGDGQDTVYDQKVWWSDDWTPFSYSKEVDFDRPFFDQFSELLRDVPRLAVLNAKSENSTYTNYSTENKDCYMTVGAWKSENVHHSYRAIECENVLDSYDLFQCQDCYQCLESKSLSHCYYGKDCHTSSDLVL